MYTQTYISGKLWIMYTFKFFFRLYFLFSDLSFCYSNFTMGLWSRINETVLYIQNILPFLIKIEQNKENCKL